MTATDILDAIEGRASAATEGPWAWYDNESDQEVTLGPDAYAASLRTTWERETQYVGPLPVFVLSAVEYEQESTADAVFIAHAREDVPALVAALRALLLLHRPVALMGVECCNHCVERSSDPDDKFPVSVDYPCTTVRVIEETLSDE